MHVRLKSMRHALGAVLAAVCFPVWAQPGVTPAASAPAVALPLAVEKALQRAKVPREALSAVVMEAELVVVVELLRRYRFLQLQPDGL